MTPDKLDPTRARHPWLAQFVADPDAAFADFIKGYADIAPFQRADIPDAAWQIFRAVPQDDPARQALGGAILVWLEARMTQRIPGQLAARRRQIREVTEVFEIIVLLDVAEAALWCFDNRVQLGHWTAQLADSPDRDARAGLLRMLALAQPLLADLRDITPLVPLWQDICAKSGSALPDYYLEIGLLGLRRLPAISDQSDVTPWIAGLAHWALVQNPSDAEFLRHWRFLKRLYPRTPASWRKEVSRLLGQKRFREADIEAPAWWAKDDDLAPLGREGTKREAPRSSPMPNECTSLIRQLQNDGYSGTAAHIRAFVDQHKGFARGTGVADHLLAAFHRLGRALIAAGGEEELSLAEALARESLRWNSDDAHSWSLWADVLEAAGKLDAAEVIRWEQMRRLPFNIDARTQLAEYLIAVDRIGQARTIVDAALADGIANAVTHAIHVRLAAHLAGVDAAETALAAALELFPTDVFLRDYRAILERGDLPWLISLHYQDHPVIRSGSGIVSDPVVVAWSRFAELRRLGDELAQGATRDAATLQVKRILAEAPEFAYAQLLAARHGLWAAEASALPDPAAAFEQALHEADRDKLEQLAQRGPRLQVLILVAQALFGDAEAARKIDLWLDSPVADGNAVTSALHGRLAAERRDGDNVVAFAQIVAARRPQIRRILQLCNEAGVMSDLFAA